MPSAVDQLVEKSPLWKLKDSLSDAQSSTKKMLSKLEKFERRLGNLDSKISRIQTTTENYSRARENICLVLSEVQKTNEFFRVAKEVEPAIKAKLTNAKAFFLGIERLTVAKNFFTTHEKGIKASGQALKTIDALLKRGVAACCEELEKSLSSNRKTAELTDEDQSKGLSLITPSAIKDIKAISDCLDTNGYSDHYAVYESVRTSQAIADLKDHITVTSSGWESLSQDIPYQRGTHPLKSFAALVHALLRNEMHIWNSIFSSRSDLSLKAYVNVCHAIISVMQDTLFPLEKEGKDGAKAIKVNLLNDCGSSQISKQSNLLLIRLDMFDIFMTRFEDMRDLCNPDPRQQSKAGNAVSSIKLRIVQLCMLSVQQLLASTLDTQPSSSAASAHSQAQGKADDDQFTCDLQPISGNILYCCKELMNFTSVYKRMYDLVAEIRTEDSPDAPALTDLVATLLGNVFKTLLKKAAKFDPVGKSKVSRSMNMKGHALFEAGEKDGDGYLLWARKHLFLSNNLYSLHIYLQEKKRDLQAYTSASTVKGGKAPIGAGGMGLESLRMLLQLADTVEKRLATEQEEFCETVAGGLSFTLTEMSEFYEEYQSANKTEKLRLLKSKFSLFNSGMDALLSQQGEWRVSSSLLRELLGTQLLEKVHPPYEDFYGKYSKVQFSKKHMSEYLRFPPEDVERSLKFFFGKC